MQLHAVATVSNGSIVANRTSPNVTYDKNTGVLDFPNPPPGQNITASVSNFDDGSPYITTTHWIKDIGPHHIVVMQSALDTGGRTWVGRDFTAIIVSA